jgi:mannose-6-phosphate isomerase-like protein (cupin superfamily)
MAEAGSDAPVVANLDDMLVSPTAALFEGDKHSEHVDTSIFVTRTPPGKFVELHVHPYAETFILLAGNGRWTCGEHVVEPELNGVIIVPPDTPHGFRNIGDEPLLVVSTHERGTIEQSWLGRDPA